MDNNNFICCECLKNININDGNIEPKLCYPCMTEIIKNSIPVINCKKCKKERFKESKQKSDKKYQKKYLTF